MESYRRTYFAFSDVLNNRPQNLIQILLRVFIRPLFNIEMQFMAVQLIATIELILLWDLVINV